jgi:hypothetical protein
VSYKVVVPPRISRSIRKFGLSRQVLLDLFLEIHEGMSRKYDPKKAVRTQDARFTFYRISLSDDSGRDHLFVLRIDDSTSPDHLFIKQIGYAIL